MTAKWWTEYLRLKIPETTDPARYLHVYFSQRMFLTIFSTIITRCHDWANVSAPRVMSCFGVLFFS